jgi:hypothetical protein
MLLVSGCLLLVVENEHYKFLSFIRMIIENITYLPINQKFNQQPATRNKQLELINFID